MRSRVACCATARSAAATQKPQHKHGVAVSLTSAVASARRSARPENFQIFDFLEEIYWHGPCNGALGCPTHYYREVRKVLQKDGCFRRRDEGLFRQNQPIAPTPAPAANAVPASPSSIAETKAEERKEAKLVVGPDIKMKGAEISDCDTLVVEGRMEATLDSRVLEITQHGVFQGTIAVDNAEIHGRFEGELTVRKQLIIQGTGKVSGKIRYAKIKIEEGAELSGEVSTLDKAASAGVTTARRVGVA